MHSRSTQNYVLFNQYRENGFNCKWIGLKNMIIHELVTVCSSHKDVDTFKAAFELFFQEDDMCCSEDLASYLLQVASPKIPLDAVSDDKFHSLFGLFKKHWSEFITTLPSVREVIHEILNICAKNYDVNEVAENILLEIVTSDEEVNEDYQAVISYLTEHRGVDVNALEESDFSYLLECLKNVLLDLCSVFSTPTTNVFLHTKLDAGKIDLIWATVLKYLSANLISGSVDMIRLFIKRGFDVEEALFSVDFSNISISNRCRKEQFNDFLDILEIFIDLGARLNPLPGSDEQPFLHGVLQVHKELFDGIDTRPTLYGFITKCIQRGVDPKSTFAAGGLHEDLLCAVCSLYNAADKNKLIEYLCDCGADGSLNRNNGLDLWSRLSYRSRNELTFPRSNEALLLLLRRGLRTGCTDEDGNNVLHMYFRMYSFTCHLMEGCCFTRLLCTLDELKFWDVLSALLDSGVQANHLNNKGEIPLDLLKDIMQRSVEIDEEGFCSKCIERYIVEPPSFDFGFGVQEVTSVDFSSIDLAAIDVAAFVEVMCSTKAKLRASADLKVQVARARKCLERLFASSHQSA